MLSRPQNFLNMRDYQRKLIKACLKNCNVILLLTGIIPWSKRVRVVLLTGAYSSFFLCNGLPLQFDASFPSLCEVSDQWFHSWQHSHGAKCLLTNVTGNLLSKYWLKIKTSFGFFLPPWGCYYTGKAQS